MRGAGGGLRGGGWFSWCAAAGGGGRSICPEKGYPQTELIRVRVAIRRFIEMSSRWSASEFGLLWFAVSRHGRRWREIVGSGLVPGRGARALECAWSDFCARGPSSMPVVQVFVAGLPVGLLAGLVSPLPLELLPRGGRLVHNGRPWEYVVRRTSSPRATREPTARQKLLTRNYTTLAGCMMEGGLLSTIIS